MRAVATDQARYRPATNCSCLDRLSAEAAGQRLPSVSARHGCALLLLVCRPLMHALLEPGIAGARGIEIDRIKCDKAAAFLKQVRWACLLRRVAWSWLPSAHNSGSLCCHLACGATACLPNVMAEAAP